MRILLPILLAFTVLTSCQPSKEEDEAINKLIFETIEKSLPDEKPGCDSLKFPDFKYNLKEIELKISRDFLFEIDNIAEKFIGEQCQNDTLYCGEIYLKHRKYYSSVTGYELFSFGYAYKNSQDEIEEKSASFFVFGARKNGRLVFHEIADDLIGEIQLELSGFEAEGKRMILWGEMYPYFSAGGYGKFKLVTNGKRTTSEFECWPEAH